MRVAKKNKFSENKSIDEVIQEISAIQNDKDLTNYFSEININDTHKQYIIPIINNIIQEKRESLKQVQLLEKYISAVKDSPFLPQSIQQLKFQGIIDRDWVLKNEYNKKIDEKLGTAFIFKERAKEFASILGLDGDTMRLAATEAIHNMFEYGEKSKAEIEIKISQINTNNPYLEMSFKHEVPENQYYSLEEANKNADEGIINFENDRGRGEFMMREIMDERKFINGNETNEMGEKIYFFKRILRKYVKSNKKNTREVIDFELKNVLNSTENYQIIKCMTIDYKSKKRFLTIAANSVDSEKMNNILSEKKYKLLDEEKYKQYQCSNWELPKSENDQNAFDLTLEIDRK